ncbi:MAG: Piwi domain-containing protein [Planctomycetaceae bacterium]
MAPVTVTFEESPMLFQRLVNDAVEARLLGIGFHKCDQHAAGAYFASFEKPSLLARIPALAEAASEPLGIYPKIYTSAYFTRDASDRLVLGLLVDVLYTTRLDTSAAQWAAAGLGAALQDTYVVLRVAAPEAERYPALAGRVIGKIEHLRDSGTCVLTDLREASLVELPLSSVAPEPTRDNLGRYLTARHEEAYRRGEQELITKLRTLVRPKERLRLAKALVTELLQPGGSVLQILPGVTATIGTLAPVGAKTFPARKLAGPQYSFDRAGTKLSRRIDEGLKQHGPYDWHLMRQRRPRVLVIAPVENEREVRAGIQKLLNGVPTPAGVFTGLQQMYRLAQLKAVYAFAPPHRGAVMQRYAEAFRAAGRGEGFDLVITVIQAAHADLPDSENPYFQTKALALTMAGIPTQALWIEKLREPDSNLQYILNTMALACYAKLGGTSHVLRLADGGADEPTELVFGIGRAVHRSTRFGDARSTIGFATVFRANGEYLYNDATPYCAEEEYERALEKTIMRSVDQIAAFENLSEGARLRLIFHVPRRAGRREERAVLNAVGKLPKFQIDFALVHVNDDHHVQLYDTSGRIPGTRRPKPEAAFLPERGWSVTFGPRERLVTFVGPDQYRGYGFPAPLKLTLDKRSTFRDLEYLVQQAYLMSFMSARSLNPGIKPVTLIYAEQLARVTGHLRAVQEWTVDMIQQRLGRRLWFV